VYFYILLIDTLKAMCKNWFILCGWILAVLVGGCAQREEGCTDPYALNFEAAANKDCCCEYPQLKLRLYYMVGNSTFEAGDELEDEYGNRASLLGFVFYVSDVRLRGDGAWWYCSDSTEVSGERVPNRYCLARSGVGLYEVGRWSRVGAYDSVGLSIGLDEAATTADYSLYSGGHPLAVQSDSMYSVLYDSYLYQKWRFAYSGDTTTYIVRAPAYDTIVSMPIMGELGTDVQVSMDVQLQGLLDGVDLGSMDSATIARLVGENVLRGVGVHL
jgi:hypothetical protein